MTVGHNEEAEEVGYLGLVVEQLLHLFFLRLGQNSLQRGGEEATAGIGNQKGD